MQLPVPHPPSIPDELCTVSGSLNLSNYLLVKEYITYLPTPPQLNAPAAQTTTTFSQRAIIDCVGFTTGLLARAAKKLEDISFQRFGDNAGKGKLGLLHVCAALWGNAEQ